MKINFDIVLTNDALHIAVAIQNGTPRLFWLKSEQQQDGIMEDPRRHLPPPLHSSLGGPSCFLSGRWWGGALLLPAGALYL